MGINYNVSIGVNTFDFKDGATAIGISELLVNHFVPSEYNTDLTILIAVEKDDEAEEETEKDDE